MEKQIRQERAKCLRVNIIQNSNSSNYPKNKYLQYLNLTQQQISSQHAIYYWFMAYPNVFRSKFHLDVNSAFLFIFK